MFFALPFSAEEEGADIIVFGFRNFECREKRGERGTGERETGEREREKRLTKWEKHDRIK